MGAWQKARAFMNSIYDATSAEGFAADPSLKDGMRRTAVAVMSNLAEAFEHAGLAEFYNYATLARGLTAELRSQLYVAADRKYLDAAKLETVHDELRDLARAITGLRTSSKDREAR
jgi:four helix bundle protein